MWINMVDNVYSKFMNSLTFWPAIEIDSPTKSFPDLELTIIGHIKYCRLTPEINGIKVNGRKTIKYYQTT